MAELIPPGLSYPLGGTWESAFELAEPACLATNVSGLQGEQAERGVRMRVRHGGSRSGTAGPSRRNGQPLHCQKVCAELSEKQTVLFRVPPLGELLQRELGDSQGQAEGRQRPQVKTEKGLGLAAVHISVYL